MPAGNNTTSSRGIKSALRTSITDLGSLILVQLDLSTTQSQHNSLSLMIINQMCSKFAYHFLGTCTFKQKEKPAGLIEQYTKVTCAIGNGWRRSLGARFVQHKKPMCFPHSMATNSNECTTVLWYIRKTKRFFNLILYYWLVCTLSNGWRRSAFSVTWFGKLPKNHELLDPRSQHLEKKFWRNCY